MQERKTIRFCCAPIYLWLVAFSAIGCGGTTDSFETSFDAAGPFDVGVTTVTIEDTTRSRTLITEIWYPAKATPNSTTSPVIDFELSEPNRTVLTGLLATAPEMCVTKSTNAFRDANPEGKNHALILYTHCHNCTRWSAHEVLERLASNGFVVVAVDHPQNTLFDQLSDTAVQLTPELVTNRIADIRFVLDQLTNGSVLPTGVSIDSDRIGMMGHSVGSITAGGVAATDARIDAVLGLAAPMENPLLPVVEVADIDVPLALVVATEDNSIGNAGNIFIRLNYDDANLPVYRMEIEDAGHWSVTNIAGLADFVSAGCGEDTRQTNSEPFSYVPVEQSIDATASFATAFFAAYVRNEDDALTYLKSDPRPVAAPIVFRVDEP